MAFDPHQNQKRGGAIAAVLSESIQLFVSCNDLLRKDVGSASDPFVIVYEKRSNRIDKKTGRKIEGFVELGRTEMIKDNPNPIFETFFEFDYFFEETQILRFDCWDYDDNHNHDFLGSCTMEVGEILHSNGSIKRGRLLSKKGKSLKNKKTKMYQTLTARIEKPKNSNRDIVLQLGATSLPKMDTFGSCDGYFKIYRINQDTKQNVLLWNKRVTTDDTNKKDGWVVWGSKKPIWPQFHLSLQSLCECDIDKQCILIEVWDADKSSDDDLVGSVIYSFNELKNKKEKILHKAKHKNKDRGHISILKCEILPSMIDFIQGGCNLSLSIAIDFTGSNGDPRDKYSLHNIGENGKFIGNPSKYQSAIRQIGNIVSSYDSDQLYPVYGFGIATKHPQTKKWTTHHSMALNKWVHWQGKEINNKNQESSEVYGIYGIEKLYIKTIEQICNSQTFVFSGPTNFSGILTETNKIAKESLNYFLESNKEGQLNYHILLLLTDGAISSSDEQLTCNLIVEAANNGYPLSIIIVGIGDADFGFLEKLDADDENSKLKHSNGKYMKRDIVQFVKFNDYIKPGNQDRLARDTLKEVPKQFMSFIEMHKIPTPKRTVAQNIANEFALSELEQKETIYDSNDLLNDLNSMNIGGNNNNNNNNSSNFDNAPLPHGWERAYTDDGKMYYVNHSSQTTQWMHPDDPSSPQKKLAASVNGGVAPY